MFIEKRESRFTFDPGRGHTYYQSIVFYKHVNPPGFGSYQLCFAPTPSRHNQQAEGPAYPSPMATPWETMKKTNGYALGKQAKLWNAPQSFKSCPNATNIITALSPY